MNRDNVYEISNYLELEDLITFCQSSHQHMVLCYNEDLWKSMYMKFYKWTGYRERYPYISWYQLVRLNYLKDRKYKNQILYTDMPSRPLYDEDNYDEDNYDEDNYDED